MNNEYTLYKNSGQIVAIVQCDDSDLASQISTYGADLSYPGVYSWKTHYMVNDQPVAFPAKPDLDHTWDWAALVWADARTLAEVKTARWEAIKAARDVALTSGFVWNGMSFQSDSASQQHIQGGVQLAVLSQAAGQPLTINWTLEDNTVQALSGSQMIQVGIALGNFVQSIFARGTVCRAKIFAAITKDAVLAIVW